MATIELEIRRKKPDSAKEASMKGRSIFLTVVLLVLVFAFGLSRGRSQGQAWAHEDVAKCLSEQSKITAPHATIDLDVIACLNLSLDLKDVSVVVREGFVRVPEFKGN